MPFLHRADQLLNPLFQAAETLLTAHSADDAWLKSVALVQQNGGNALNVVEIETATATPVWFRSSMEGRWLDDYFAQEFYNFDPLILSACQGTQQTRMTHGKVQGFEELTPRTAAFADQIVTWGYHTLDYYVFATNNDKTFKGVAFSYDDQAQASAVDHQLLCAMIASVVHAPQNPQSPGATPLLAKALSVREKDVLRYLALGLRNDAIASKLGIAEITVRVHVTAARRKLGAATREQAIALAIRSGQLQL